MSLRILIISAVTAAASLASATAAAAQQAVMISGTVWSVQDSTVVLGALVRVNDTRTAITGNDGAFRVPGIEPGRVVLEVEALGHANAQVTLFVRRDTSVVIFLDVSAVQLDPIEAAARNVRIRGRVRDARDGRGIIDALAFLNGSRRERTSPLGTFTFSRVPAGEAVRVEVNAFEFLPEQAVFLPDSDTTLIFELSPDPVASRMIEAQVERIDERLNRIPGRTRSVSREEILRFTAGTVEDLVQVKLGVRAAKCLMVDERLAPFGMEELRALLPEQVQQVELMIIDRDIMVRVYTRHFMQRMTGNNVRLAHPLASPICN